MSKNISLVDIDTKPIADVINNLINKIAYATGYIVKPKGE